jgi:cell division control protein 24
LDQANEAIHKEHLAAAVVDLSERVDDWKSLKMDTFGDLLRFGTFAVVKGDSGKDSEREVCGYIGSHEVALIHSSLTSLPVSYFPF